MSDYQPTRDARMYEYEFTDHEIDGIKFKTTHFDIDYIGCGYELPQTTEKVVGYKGGFTNLHNNNINSDDYLIYISDWNKFYLNSDIFSYYLNVLVFNEDVDNKDIIKVFQKYINQKNNPNNMNINDISIDDINMNEDSKTDKFDYSKFHKIMTEEFKISDNLSYDETIVFNTSAKKIENKLILSNDFIEPEITENNNVTIIRANLEQLKVIRFPNDISNKTIVVLNNFVKETNHYHHNLTCTLRNHYFEWAIYKIYKWDDFQMEYIPDFKEFGQYDVNKLHESDDVGVMQFSAIFAFPDFYQKKDIHEYIKNYIFEKYGKLCDIHNYISKIKNCYEFNDSLNFTRGILFHPEYNEIMNYSKPLTELFY